MPVVASTFTKRLLLGVLASALLAAPAFGQMLQGNTLPQARLTQRPLIVAHRGHASADQAENSLKQMQAVATRQIGVEMDLATSKDGVLYLLHDDTLDRTTTGTGPLAAQDSQALDKLRLKDGKGQPTGEALPRLTQVLDWATQTPEVMLILDLKGTPAAKVVPLLNERKLINRAILLTFDRGRAAEALKASPDVLVSVLVTNQSDINYYRRIAGPRPLAMYVSNTAKSKLYGMVQAASAVVVTDVNKDVLAGVDTLADKVGKKGCKAYHDYLDEQHIDVLVTNNPVCAAETIK
ncbi:glycerophosphoryl diester phosphodiesterase [Pseudoxanthomonas sp. GM95]|uniref:glycerophosphodiester phosphodiesterase family protein n=1 Tax=Pseudoxanthomonas sp. GM95 TaxID=1881043 RepID=UPI0008C1B252|nr:glycerophosphodiester phosphodiesterase family protein [Pseudoxanthomonas sp. GM95]SEK54822.1 glycerophosphoryl diester phosphodiesterase [Pseudoxanthomonas sp. GM95]